MKLPPLIFCSRLISIRVTRLLTIYYKILYISYIKKYFSYGEEEQQTAFAVNGDFAAILHLPDPKAGIPLSNSALIIEAFSGHVTVSALG